MFYTSVIEPTQIYFTGNGIEGILILFFVFSWNFLEVICLQLVILMSSLEAQSFLSVVHFSYIKSAAAYMT